MWQKSHQQVYPGLTRQSVWAVWVAVDRWAEWDEELQYAKLRGPFATGSSLVLRPKGGPEVRVELTIVRPLAGFTDVTRFPLARMTDVHELEDHPDGLLVRSVIRMEGPLAWLWRRLVGQSVADGAPKQMDALARYAGTIGHGDAAHGTQDRLYEGRGQSRLRAVEGLQPAAAAARPVPDGS